MTASADARAQTGGGTLILVVGPSGAGKDTVLSVARPHFAQEPRVLFARRLVTRPQGAGEAHGTLSEAEFEAARAAGTLALSWRAHGLGYGLGPEVTAHLDQGGVAVANASREVLGAARARFAAVRVVLVSAPPEVLAQRLSARGREAEGDIAARLTRAPALDGPLDLIIENVGTPEEAGRRLAAFIARVLRAG